jgi:predicted nucleic acid-binding protein
LNYVLDTDVVSQLSKGRQDPGVIRWIDSIDDDNLFLSAATLIEVRYGIELLDLGKKRQLLEEWLVQKLPRQFDGNYGASKARRLATEAHGRCDRRDRDGQ